MEQIQDIELLDIFDNPKSFYNNRCNAIYKFYISNKANMPKNKIADIILTKTSFKSHGNVIIQKIEKQGNIIRRSLCFYAKITRGHS